jgi:dynein heavy chain
LSTQTTKKRLNRAGTLTASLANEEARWEVTAAEFGHLMECLVGDVFIGAAYVSYLGAFTGPYRLELVGRWSERLRELGVPVSDKYTLLSTLASPVEVREWSIWGLPTDSVSVDNGILVTRGRRWPLMIDPQGQANKWVKHMEASKGDMRVTRQTDPTFLRTLETAIRMGTAVLCEDVGEVLDPSLEPILQKQVFKQGNRLLMRVGDPLVTPL